MVQGEYLFAITCTFDQGQTEFRAEYDAWGRQNVVTDNLAHFQRGYCGHEHWHEFDLIDMNGRMYDPVIARFLSPDPFVQAPEDLQNYNRYSYCLNNPLKYTDPSGEIFWEAVAVGAIIGGIVNVTAAYSKPGVVTNRQTIAYIFAGAAVGAVSTLCGGVGVAGIVPGSFAGAALGGISGAASAASLTVANNLISGNEWNTGMKDALLSGFVGGAIWGAFSGGYAGFTKAKESGLNYWSGKEKLVDNPWSIRNDEVLCIKTFDEIDSNIEIEKRNGCVERAMKQADKAITGSYEPTYKTNYTSKGSIVKDTYQQIWIDNGFNCMPVRLESINPRSVEAMYYKCDFLNIVTSYDDELAHTEMINGLMFYKSGKILYRTGASDSYYSRLKKSDYLFRISKSK